MANFHNLPLGIHLKLATYLNVQDKISVSQSCRAVRNLYRNASFQNTYVTGYEKPQARMLIRTGDLGYTIRAIPFMYSLNLISITGLNAVPLFISWLAQNQTHAGNKSLTKLSAIQSISNSSASSLTLRSVPRN